jgi:hypothetical protein
MRAAWAANIHNINLCETGFGYSTEMLVKARAMGYSIAEVPTVVRYHKEFKKNSSMDPVLHGLRVMLCTIKWRIKCELFS